MDDSPRPSPGPWLGLDPQTTTLRSPAGTFRFAFGPRAIASRWPAAQRPGPLELEQAIAWVEDELMRVRPPHGGNVVADGDGEALPGIARAAGLQPEPGALLDRATVEALFGRLAAVALGRPAAREGLPDDAEFAAALLIVRELLHHLGLAGIRLAPSGAPQPEP